MSYRHILGKLLNFDLLRVREKQMSELVDKNILLPHRQAPRRSYLVLDKFGSPGFQKQLSCNESDTREYVHILAGYLRILTAISSQNQLTV